MVRVGPRSESRRALTPVDILCIREKGHGARNRNIFPKYNSRSGNGIDSRGGGLTAEILLCDGGCFDVNKDDYVVGDVALVQPLKEEKMTTMRVCGQRGWVVSFGDPDQQYLDQSSATSKRPR
jgi:hypothetical protein